MAKATILFMTNSELGQATVCLAVAHEFLTRQSYSVHIASFSPLEPAIYQLNARAGSKAQSVNNTATFHTITGKSMIKAAMDRIGNTNWFGVHDIGFYGALRAYSYLVNSMMPWTPDEYIETYHSCVEIIQKLQPSLIAVDPFFSQGLDASCMLRCKYVILGPNSVKDHVVQPMLGNLWKYPILCSGYSFPLPWKHVIPNAFLALTLGAKVIRSPDIKALNKRRHAEGIQGGLPILLPSAGHNVPLLIASRAELDFPSFVPKNISMCGPILRPSLPISEESPDLAEWLSQRPTVLVNLGSNVCFSRAHAKKFASGLRILLDARPDIQVLWKLKPDRQEDVSDWISVALPGILDELLDERVRVEEWLPVEPICILQSGQVCCVVHHGGANSYNEAMRAGIPQIILPVWYDTYDYAVRVEYLGVGVWGSKTSAPAINGPELGRAFIRVLHSEESLAMREKARSIASKLADSDGRIVAYEKMVAVMEG